jgi:hypothetical protein
MNHPSLFSAVCLALGLAACGADQPSEDLEPTLGNVQSAVFTPTCALSGCHDRQSRAEDQDLSPGRAYASLVNVRSIEDPSRLRVEPGAPERSYLVAKLRGGPGIQGARMPLNEPPLEERRIRLVEAWIAAGAPPE